VYEQEFGKLNPIFFLAYNNSNHLMEKNKALEFAKKGNGGRGKRGNNRIEEWRWVMCL
jgi:hypothetical protein